MSEEIESEQYLSHDEIADVFENFARELRIEEPVRLAMAGKHVEIDPSDPCEFEVEVEEEGDERSVEFELEWDTGADEGPLVVEEE